MKITPLRFLAGLLFTMACAGVASAQDRRPVARTQVPPVFPYEMSQAGIGGRVVVSFVINHEGIPVDVRVLQATRREFEIPAIQATLKWRFQPGMKDGKPVAVRVSQVLDFELLASPVYPAELLRNGQAGRATVEFSVDEQGRAFEVKAVEATHAKFAASSRAAAVDSVLGPPLPNAPSTRRQMEFRFEPNGKGDSRVDDYTRKFLTQLKKTPEVAEFSELDAPPEVKKKTEPRVAPDVMAAVGAGTALVAVYVDAKGNVILPEVVSATHEDLGYAAVQAIMTWKYAPPKKGDRPVPAHGIVEIAFGPQ